MTAAIITGGAGPSLTEITELLEKCDLLIAADSGLEKCAQWGLTPHLFVGDGDSLTQDLRELATSLGWIPASRDKDFSDTELALHACQERGADTIHLVGGGEGRMDHLLANLLLFRHWPSLRTWTTAREFCRILEPGSSRTVHKSGAVISLHPLDLSGCVETCGLVWELGQVDFSRLMSLSNRASGSSVEWKVKEGRFLMMESYG